MLADFTHPNIARLYDAGETEAGLEYLVLELIDGVPITAYCRAHALGAEARVALVIAVLDALDAAHRNLIAHRDLKPSNILVERSGTPKLLDFGIAKPLDAGTAAARVADGLMTPEYASPEQLAGGALTTATDLFSLGVVLRELLAAAPAPARDRSDLDAILAKALAHDPRDRYASAGALREDLERYLAREPVAARPLAAAARLAKLVRRRPLASGAIAAVSLALLVLTVLVFAQSFALKKSLAEESLARDRAESVNAFLRGVLEQADPWKEPNRELTLAAALERAEAQLGSRWQAQPAVEAEVRLLLAGAYASLNRFDASLPHAQRAHALLEPIAEAEPARFAHASRRLGSALRNLGKSDESLAALEPALAFARRRLPGDLETIELSDQLAQTLRALGRYEESEHAYREALAAARAYAPDGYLVAQELNNLSSLLKQRGRTLDLPTMYAESLRLARAALGAKHPGTATAEQNLALTLWRQGALERAAPAAQNALAVRREVLGPGNPDTLLSATTAALVLGAQGRAEEALAALDAMPLGELDAGPRSRARLAFVLQARAELERDAGRRAEALRDIETAFGHAEAALGKGDMVTGLIRTQRAQLRAESGASEAAVADLTEWLAASTPRLGADHFAIGTARAALGEILRAQGRCDAAEPELGAAAAALEKSVGKDSRAWLEAELARAACERARGAADTARARIAAIAARNPELVRDGAVLAQRFADAQR